MKRKLTSLLMALVMTLSLAAPAFATASNYFEAGDAKSDMQQTMTFNATTRVPKISLSLPTLSDNPVVFNPYQIEYTSDDDTLNGVAIGTPSGGTSAGDNPDATKQIISPIYDIVSLSDTKLTVGVNAKTTVAGNLTLATAEPADTETKNAVFVRMDFVATKDNVDTGSTNATITALKNNVEQKLCSAADTIDTAFQTAITQAKVNATKSLTLTAGDKAAEIKVKDSTLILDKTVGGEDVSKASHLFFQFAGKGAKNPTTPWTADDKFTTVVVFTFQPSATAPAQNNTPATTPDATYNAASPAAIAFTTTAPNDADQTTPAYTVTSVGGLTGVTASNCTWNGTTLTIPTSELSGATELGTNGNKTLTIGVSYSDGSNTKTDSLSFTLAVTGN